MRRADRQLDRQMADKIFDTCPFVTLCLTSPEGTPYGVPLNMARQGDTLYFHCAHDGRKVESLRANPKVWVVAVGATHAPDDRFTMEYESAMACGCASEVTDAAEKTTALRLLCERFTPANMPRFEEAVARSLAITAIWKIEMGDVTAKRNGQPAASRTPAQATMPEK